MFLVLVVVWRVLLGGGLCSLVSKRRLARRLARRSLLGVKVLCRVPARVLCWVPQVICLWVRRWAKQLLATNCVSARRLKWSIALEQRVHPVRYVGRSRLGSITQVTWTSGVRSWE